MEFATHAETAAKWIEENKANLELIPIEEERKIMFKSIGNDALSFYVVCPSTEDTKWNCWSDSDEVLQHMAEVQDYMDSCRKKSVTDILNKVKSSLKQILHNEVGDADDNDEDDEDIDDGYDEDDFYDYEEEDRDAMTDKTLETDNSEDLADEYFMGDGSPLATKRLLSDLKRMKDANGKFGVTGTPRGDNLFIWDVKLTDFPADTSLGKDLIAYAKKYKKEPVVYMEMKFPKDYPMAPPFVRVLQPRFKFLTGHVTIGGSVCLQMLTRSGWCPSNDIESILVQIRAEIMSDPNARLDSNPNAEYSEEESRKAFDRMVSRYGWNK